MAVYVCDGYWKSNPELGMTNIEPFTNHLVSDTEWNGVEDAEDARIFYYTEGLPVVGDHGEFVIMVATNTEEV